MKYTVLFGIHIQTFTNMNNLIIKKRQLKHNYTGVLHNGATLRGKLGLNQPNLFLVNNLETCLKFSPDKYHGCTTMLQ